MKGAGRECLSADRLEAPKETKAVVRYLYSGGGLSERGGSGASERKSKRLAIRQP